MSNPTKAQYWRERRREQRIEGRCYHCGKKTKNRAALCAEHKKLQRIAKGLSPEVEHVHRCSLCGQQGHNARRCWMMEPVA